MSTTICVLNVKKILPLYSATSTRTCAAYATFVANDAADFDVDADDDDGDVDVKNNKCLSCKLLKFIFLVSVLVFKWFCLLFLEHLFLCKTQHVAGVT